MLQVLMHQQRDSIATGGRAVSQMIALQALDTSDRVTEFGICSAGFCYCFDAVFPCYALFLPFGDENMYPVPLYIRNIELTFVQVHSKEVVLNLEKDWILNSDTVLCSLY